MTNNYKYGGTDALFQIRIRKARGIYLLNWSSLNRLDQMPIREEALKHPWINEVFHVTDHIVWEDKEIIAYLNDTWPPKQL